MHSSSSPLAAAGAKELKPKFGDIGGVFYTEVQENREACRQAIRNKIALCRQNTSFVSNTLDRKYPGCLPIFERQAEICVAHFRRQAGACEIQGSARITDFTGFACTVTATVVEEGGEPERAPGIAPAEKTAERDHITAAVRAAEKQMMIAERAMKDAEARYVAARQETRDSVRSLANQLLGGDLPIIDTANAYVLCLRATGLSDNDCTNRTNEFFRKLKALPSTKSLKEKSVQANLEYLEAQKHYFSILKKSAK